jgi:hypothetical protein
MAEAKMAAKVDPAPTINVAYTEFVSGPWGKAEMFNVARLRRNRRWK